MRVIQDILGPVEEVNESIQSPSMSPRTVESQVEMLCLILVEKRSDEYFSDFWKKVTDEGTELFLHEPKTPRIRKQPKRFDDGASAHIFHDPKVYYRKIYYEVIDFILNADSKRYSGCNAFSKLSKVEDEIVKCLDWKTTEKHCMQLKEAFHEYCSKDIDVKRLNLHCSMLRDILKRDRKILKSMSMVKEYLVENKSDAIMLNEIVKLVKLYYVVPVTSCTAERSFSLLRWLKTSLRTTMGQARLNHVAILNIHKEYVDELDIKLLVNEFIKKNNQRSQVFALF